MKNDTLTLIFQGKTVFKNRKEYIDFNNDLSDLIVAMEPLDNFHVESNGKVEATIIFTNVAALENRREIFRSAIDRFFKDHGKTYRGHIKMFVMEEK